MALKLAPNISMLFSEAGNLLSRYSVAQKFGFKAVECAFPYDLPIEEVKKAKNDAKVKQGE